MSENVKLQQDLLKVDQMEAKFKEELTTLREKIAKMNSELEIYSDLDRLRREAEVKKEVSQFLIAVRVVLLPFPHEKYCRNLQGDDL